MRNKQFVTRLTKFLYIFGIIFLLTGLLLSAVQIPVSAQEINGAGSLWTTNVSCGSTPQDVNHFYLGESIYLHGSGFAPNQELPWYIQKVNANPQVTVADGTVKANSSGKFCFLAYTPVASDVGYEFQSKVGTKGDNFDVRGPQAVIVLVKTASAETFSYVGETITYSYLITNSASSSLSVENYRVTDDRLSVSCPSTPKELNRGASVTCTAVETVEQADIEAGYITNHAIAYAETCLRCGGKTIQSNQAMATVTAVYNPAISIVKTADKASFSTVGEEITYSYMVKNTGNVSLNSLSVIDDKNIAVTCPVANLAAGQETTCTAKYYITQDDMDAGSVTNLGTATANSAGGSVSDDDDETITTSNQQPALALVKLATPKVYGNVGEVITYTYELTNVGNVTLTGPFVVHDDKLPGINIDCGSATTVLPPLTGETISCSADYTITQTDLDNGNVVNVASATGLFKETTVTSNQDTQTVTATGEGARLAIDKSVNPIIYYEEGQVLNYTYTVTNTGNVTLTNIFVDDDKLGDITSCASTTLAPSTSTTCTATHIITADDVTAGKVYNEAWAHGTYLEKDYASEKDTAEATVVGAPHLTLVKSVDSNTYDSVTDVLHYTYVVTNDGGVPLAGPVTITDDKIVSPNTVSCPAVSSLAVGEQTTCTASYPISQADLDVGSVENTARAFASLDGKVVESNEDSVTATANQDPKISLDKTAQETSFDAVGDQLHYNYLIKNEGNVTLTAPFTVTDNKTTVSCPTAPASLAPGETITCTATYTIIQADLDAGEVTNNATAHNGAIDSNEDSVTVDAESTPAMSIDKTVDETTYDEVGDILHYNYYVKNTGNVTLYAPFNIHDDRIGLLDCPADVTSLAPGADVTCEGTYPISIANLNDGAVGNTAYATGFDGDGGVVMSNMDTVIVYGITPGWTLQLTKTVDPLTYANVGDTLTYTYTLLNTGNMILYAPFSVDDDKLGADEIDCSTIGGSLASGASGTCTAEHIVTQEDLNAGEIVNVATAYARNYFEATITSNQATATATAAQTLKLTLDKEVTPAQYMKIGDVLSYTYLLKNEGNVTLTGPFTVEDNKATVTCPDTEDLLPGESITCTASYTVDQDDLDDGSVTNVATGHAFFGTTAVDSNEDTATANALVETGLAIDKAAVETSYSRIGDVINYTYTLTNIGQTTLYGPFSVFDDKTSDEACELTEATDTLLPGDTTTCSASYTIVEANLIAGSVTNVAYAQGFFKGNPVLSREDTETVNATIITPTVTIEGVQQNTCQVEAGRTCLDFTVTVTNLTVGAIDFFADEPSVIDDGEVTSFTADGTYIVTVCGEWPGISDPSQLTELTLAAHADWVIRPVQMVAEAVQNPAPTGQEDIAIGTGKITYDPANRLTCFPQSSPTFATPFCNLVNDQWTMAVNLRNPNDTAMDITWTLDSGSVKSATIDAYSTIRLGNLDLNERHTVAVYWGQDGFLELRPRLNTSDCVTPPEPPVVVYSIPVTAVEVPPAPVTEAVLIPVTGADLGGAQDGFINKLMMYLGVSLLGMAFIAHSLRNKFLK